MRKRTTEIRGIPRIIAVGVIGAFIGLVVAAIANPVGLHRTTLLPDAYRVPKIPGGTPLRMAMVHDVLHERYLRHGTTWYQQRNKDAQKILDADPAGSEKYLNAMDDLAVGLERTEQLDQAINLLRKKLILLQAVNPIDPPTTAATTHEVDPESSDLLDILAAAHLPPDRQEQYSAYANLGTVLVRQAMLKAMAGDPAAKSQVREALRDIEQAIAINPGSHFGRERWQAIAMEDLLYAVDHPDLLEKYDLFGDSLDDDLSDRGYTLRYPGNVYVRGNWALPADDRMSVEDRLRIRRMISRTCIDDKWAERVRSDYISPMPFDEPTLAIIGMWTMGGGPNAHFAQCLGRIMQKVGERLIAWNAFERAVELRATYWPDEKIQDQMVLWCRSQQNAIAIHESPDSPDAWQQTMRKQHQAELAWGIDYQNAYHDYEARQIAKGVSLDDPNFYTEFFKNRPPIASRPGQSDDLVITHLKAANFADSAPLIVLGLGLGMLIALVLPEKHLS
jgi:tetratricopeptide (TPR) repeat protein